jgi:hypothetical protein
MLNDHVQNPNRNNSLKDLHTFGRAEFTTSRAKRDVTLEVKVAKINQ